MLFTILFQLCEYSSWRYCKVLFKILKTVQQVKLCVVIPDGLSSTPRTHMVETER